MKLRNCVDFLLQMYNVQHEEGLQLQQTTVVHVISFHLNAQSVIFFHFLPDNKPHAWTNFNVRR